MAKIRLIMYVVIHLLVFNTESISIDFNGFDNCVQLFICGLFSLTMTFMYGWIVTSKQKISVFNIQHKEMVVDTFKQALIFEQKMNQTGKKDMLV